MKLSFAQLTDALRGAGLVAGDTVLVQSSLLHIGPVEGVSDRQRLVEFYYRAFREVIGDAGTILVHTPFEAYGRTATPFDIKRSPSTGGALSQFVLDLPGAVRSSHPIVSAAGVGPAAQGICGGDHFSGFGWNSPWGRMHRRDVKFVTLGIGLSKGLSFLHYIEAMHGVPYQYTKLYSVPVLRDGEPVHGDFTLSVRYLDFSIRYNYLNYEIEMLAAGQAIERRFERGLLLQSTTANKAFEFGLACLTHNRYAFLDTPPKFRTGDIPYDGPTGEMRWVYHEPRNSEKTL